MSRAERKALKKLGKQPAVVDEEDKDLINPNRLPVKNLTISDIGAPRELSRRERYAYGASLYEIIILQPYKGKPRKRPRQRRDIGSESIGCSFLTLSTELLFTDYIKLVKPMKPREIWQGLPRSDKNVRLPLLPVKMPKKVSSYSHQTTQC